MADIARCWQEQGLVAGWVALDGDDTPRVLGSHLAAAFEQGGLALSSLRADDGWTSSPAVQQIGILARAIELGWPFAVMVYRNVRVGEANETGPNTAGLTEDYIRVRLLSDLSLEDRASLLDLAVFDWIDTDLVDDVLDSSDARVRVAALPALDGLVGGHLAADAEHPDGEAPDSWFDVHVATIAIVAEPILERHDVEAVIRFLRKSAEGVWATNIESMSNNVSALLAHYLAEAGRPDEAGEVWRDYGLPCGATELVDLERNRTRGIQQRTLKGLTHLRGTWNGIYAVAVGVSAELMSTQYDSESVIPFLTQALEEVEPAGSRSLSNYMSGLLVFYLLDVGCSDQATQVWRDRGLPTAIPELVDLERQP